jgi:hypothetical protein
MRVSRIFAMFLWFPKFLVPLLLLAFRVLILYAWYGVCAPNRPRSFCLVFSLFRCAELQTKLFSFIQIIEDTHSFLFLSSSLPSFVVSTSICIYSPPASLPLPFFFCLFSLSLALCLCLCVYHYPNTFFFL